LKRDFRILTEIRNLLYKEKNKPSLIQGSDMPREQKTDKILNKNQIFPLSIIASPSSNEKGSFFK